MNKPAQLQVSPKKVFLVLTGITLFLSVMHLVTQYMVYFTDQGDSGLRALNTFYMANEVSIPTWYNQAILLVASFLVFVIAVHKRHEKNSSFLYWLCLAGVFLYLSVDEGSQLHEQLGFVSYRFLRAIGFGGFSTTSYYLISLALLVLVVGLFFVRFWWRLPKTTKILFLVAAILYVGGALGVEAVGQFSERGSFSYSALVLLEETLEKMGIVVFIYALLDYIRSSKVKSFVEFK